MAQPSALEEISDEEAISISVPSAIPPASTTLRDYVDKSETLSKLVQLGNQNNRFGITVKPHLQNLNSNVIISNHSPTPSHCRGELVEAGTKA